MDLEISGPAIVKNVNLRRECHGEDRELGCDVKLEVHADMDALAHFSPTLKALLYVDPDSPTNRALRMPDLKPLRFETVFENHTLVIAGISYADGTVGKVAVDPEPDGRVLITMTVSFSKISGDAVAELAEVFVGESAEISIEPQQLSLLDRAA